MHVAAQQNRICSGAFQRCGFTLVEIMVTVCILAILTAIALPNFIKYRSTAQMNACVANLKTVQAAYEQAKLMGGGTVGGGQVSISHLIATDGYIKKHLWCPADKSKLDDAAYEIGEDEQPLCIAHGSDEEFPHRLTRP